MISKRFRIDISSDLEYEDLVADVYFDDQIVFVVTQEHGFENMEIEIYSPENQGKWLFKMSEFEDVVRHAKERLWDLRKIIE